MRSSFLVAAGLTAAALSSCEPKLDTPPATTIGSIDASRYVALGDDYTAGTANAGLTRERQEYSFPNLFAKQLQLAGGGAFTQPLLAANESTGGLLLAGLSANNLALTNPAAVTALDQETLNAGSPCVTTRYRFPQWSGAGTIPNNLGVPGLRLQDLSKQGLGDDANLHNPAALYNGNLERLLPDDADSRSYLTLMRQSQPTFVTVSIGLSDLLPYIFSGGTCGTPPVASDIKAATNTLIDSLLANTSAKGILLSAPKLSSLPLTTTDVADINRSLGRNDTVSMFVQQPDGTITPTTSTDIVLLPMVGRVGRSETATGDPASAPFGLSRDNPLRYQDVLPSAKATTVDNLIYRTNSINQTLLSRANGSNGRLIYVDINSLYLAMLTGRYIDGVRYSGDPVTGGLFSLDGYTLTPRGNALLVNYIIQTINNSEGGFGSRIPQIDINSLPPTPLP